MYEKGFKEYNRIRERTSVAKAQKKGRERQKTIEKEISMDRRKKQCHKKPMKQINKE